MNPVFVFLVLLAGFLLWLLCSFLYRPIGMFVKKLFWNAQDAMDKDEEEVAIDEYVKGDMEDENE